jgi:hypothetical protein
LDESIRWPGFCTTCADGKGETDLEKLVKEYQAAAKIREQGSKVSAAEAQPSEDAATQFNHFEEPSDDSSSESGSSESGDDAEEQADNSSSESGDDEEQAGSSDDSTSESGDDEEEHAQEKQPEKEQPAFGSKPRSIYRLNRKPRPARAPRPGPRPGPSKYDWQSGRTVSERLPERPVKSR